MPPHADLPPGFTYRDEFLPPEEESDLIARIERLPFGPVRMKGVIARRTVVHYGWDYGYESWRIQPTDPIPPFLLSLRERCAEAAGLRFDGFTQLLVSRYPPGAGIGWHRDAPMFGPVVAGVSLLGGCRLRLRRGPADAREVRAIELLPRSLYLLTGEARSAWQHSIPAVSALRYSVTLRQVRAAWSRLRETPGIRVDDTGLID